MISLTNFLLLLILASFTTYTFMPWRGIDKGSKRKIGLQLFQDHQDRLSGSL